MVVSYTSVFVDAARSNIRLGNELCFPCEKQSKTLCFPFLHVWVIIDLELHVIQRNRIQPKNSPLESSPICLIRIFMLPEGLENRVSWRGGSC